jgi:hypothetical protein
MDVHGASLLLVEDTSFKHVENWRGCLPVNYSLKAGMRQ